MHSYVTKSLKPTGECPRHQGLTWSLLGFSAFFFFFIVIISCHYYLKTSSSYCALNFAWEILPSLETNEQEIFWVLNVFTLSSYILDNMIWYRILSWKYFLKEIESIAPLFPSVQCYLWSIDSSLTHLCIINFLCLISLPKRFWNVSLHWDWRHTCVDLS